MKIYLLCALSSFIICIILLIFLIPMLRKLRAGQYILSYVRQHKNKGGTPTMGGLAFITAIIIISLGYCGLHNKTINLTLAITGGFAMVGFMDDFLKIYRKDNQGLKPYQKIIFQMAIALIAAMYCYFAGFTKIIIPLSFGIQVNISWGIIPLTIFVFIATVNCVNLTDGLDGLASGTSIAYLLIFAVMLIMQDSLLTDESAISLNSSLVKLCTVSIGALAAFAIFNVNRASIFMGDTGSLALGGLLSCISIFSGNTLFIPLIGIMFVISGISVIAQVIYYKRTRRRIFLMAPIHHHFQMKGFSECKISYVYFLATVIAGIFCIILL